MLWELLTGRIPYSDMTPLQAAVGVVQKGLRPPIPTNCPPPLSDIMRLCWQRDPAVRPSFEQVRWPDSGPSLGGFEQQRRMISGLNASSWPGLSESDGAALFTGPPPPPPACAPSHPPLPAPQLKLKMEELLEVYRQQDGAAGVVKKVPAAGAGGSGSGAAAPGGGGGGLLARLRSGSSSSSMRK